ncbi:MAG: sugar phosphate isomerase/epimerase, partial [Sphingomonadales bacterium]
MARPLGLHHITTKELEPIPFVRMAAEAGYDQVSLFTNAPLVPQRGREAMFAFPTVTPQLQREMLACLAETGIKVTGAEFFLITPDADLEAYRPGLAVGAALGAGHAVTHVFDTDKARAVDKLG